MAAETLDWDFWSSFCRDRVSHRPFRDFCFLKHFALCSRFFDRKDVESGNDHAIFHVIAIAVRWSDEETVSGSETC